MELQGDAGFCKKHQQAGMVVVCNAPIFIDDDNFERCKGPVKMVNDY